MKILQELTALIKLIEVIKELVVQFEHPGFGEEKKQAVLSVVGALYDLVDIFTPFTKEKVLEISSILIDIIVAFYNLIGKFKHSEQ
jgi:hypothetical protein